MNEIITGFIAELLTGVWETTREMAPFLLFGFLIAGILYVFIRTEIVERHLGGRGLMQVVKASILGVPLPLCSCGVIPVAASLRRHGAGRGATTSFLISTPQTGVDSIMVTLSLLGPIFAVFRPLFAFFSGIAGGSLVGAFGGPESGPGEEGAPVCVECESGAGHTEKGLGGALSYGFHSLPRDIGKALIVGILLAGLIGAVVPDDFFASVLGGGIVAMLVMMAVGIPVYVCATASVPIAAALIAKGISPGGALVFLMTGPATNAATVLTISRIMGRRTAAVYLGTVAVFALGGGLLLDAIYTTAAIPAVMDHGWMLPGWVKTSSAVLLAAVIFASFFEWPRSGAGRARAGGLLLKIRGMHCEHCLAAVTRALNETAGVDSAVVDLKKGEAAVTGGDLDRSLLEEAVEGLGYEVTSVEDLDNSCKTI